MLLAWLYRLVPRVGGLRVCGAKWWLSATTNASGCAR